MRRALAFTGPREVAVEREPLPDPAPDEVSVRTIVSAISPGSELLVYRGEAPVDLAADELIDAIDGDLRYPIRYGYAAVGDVTAVGDAIEDDWLGETVFAFHPHASDFLAEPEQLLRVPDDVSAETAALYPTAETAANLVLDGAPRLGERVAVFGQGIVGLATTNLLARFPLDQLVAVEPVAHRRALAREFGADYACAPDAIDNLYDPDRNPAGADLSYELSGNPEALDDAIRVTGFDGRVLVGSWYGTKRADLDLGGSYHRSRVRLEASQVSTIDPDLRGRWNRDRRTALAWDCLRTLPADRLVTDEVPLDRAGEAYERLDERADGAVGALFTY